MSEPSISEPIPAAPASGSRDAVAVDVLEFERGAIGGVRATEVTARLAVVGGIAARQVTIEKGAVSSILAREATVRQGVVRAVVAATVHVEQAFARVVVANTVHAGPSTTICVAVARQVDGDPKIHVDWRGGLAFGASLGAFMALARLGRRSRHRD